MSSALNVVLIIASAILGAAWLSMYRESGGVVNLIGIAICVVCVVVNVTLILARQ